MLSVKQIMEDLEKLESIHDSLLKLSEEKTEIIKKGSADRLQALLIKEQKYIQQLEQAETKRKQDTDAWFLEKKLSLEDATITNMLELLADKEEKTALEKRAIALTEAMIRLKQQEQLNRALIEQSMQFVRFNLDMLHPSLENMNYGNRKKNRPVNRSVFDSKA